MRAPAAARNFEPGQFYPPPELRGAGARASTASPLLIEPLRADGRLGRPGQGPPVDDRPRDRRLVAPLRDPEARRARRSSMGPTGTPTEIPANSTVHARRRRPRKRRPLLHRPEGLRDRGNRVIYFAGYKKAEDFYKRDEHRGGRRRASICSVDRGEAIPARRAPRTAASSATSSRRWSPTRRASSGERTIPLSRDRAPHRHRLGPDDGGRRARPARTCSRRTCLPGTSASRRSTRRCSA